MIINSTYFLQEPLFVPNISDNPGNPLVSGNIPTPKAQLEATIERVEFDILVNSLGFEQYNELKAQFNPDGTWIVDPLQKWVDFVDGKSDQNWLGLRFTIGTNKVSLLAYAVYCEVLKNKRQYFSTTGLNAPEVANSTVINPTEEITDKWNIFVTMYQGDCNVNEYDYWTNWFFYRHFNYEQVQNMVSLVDYMKSNSDLYSTEYFKRYEVKNSFGL